MFDNQAAAAGLIKDDKVKALAVTTGKRSVVLKDLPTMEQAGVKPFDIGTWFGVFTTGGTPAPVVDKLYKAYSAALADPEVVKRLETMGSNATAMTPAQFADMVKQEREKYREIIQISGAKVN